MIPKSCKRLAEVDFPIAEVSRHAAREKSIRHGHPSTLHPWWAQRPLASSRAVLMALLLSDPCDWESGGRQGLCPVPNEPTPAGGGSGAGRAFSAQRYGMLQWGDLFTARQKVALMEVGQLIRNSDCAQSSACDLGSMEARAQASRKHVMSAQTGIHFNQKSLDPACAGMTKAGRTPAFPGRAEPRFTTGAGFRLRPVGVGR